MAVPTRIIEDEEFSRLMREEQGDIIPLWRLAAIDFMPPRPDQKLLVETTAEMNILMLNVTEPVIYKGEDRTFIIINGYDSSLLTWENFQDYHMVKGAWLYRLAPAGWEEEDWNDPFPVAVYRFNHDAGSNTVEEAA